MTRGRRPNVEKSIPTNLHLPESTRTKLDIELFSEVEGRVPHGAYQRFFTERIADYFSAKALDLAPFLGTLPGAAVIRGRPEVIEALKRHLEAA